MAKKVKFEREVGLRRGFYRPGLLLLFLALPLLARADALPPQFVPAQRERFDAQQEAIGEPFPGMLLVPNGEQADTDGKYSLPFHAACYAYIAERRTSNGNVTGYARRFVVHAPDADALPLAKRVARLLLLLFGQNRERMRFDHPISAPTVDVWLMRQGGQGTAADAGGEQTKNDIYLYNLTAERKPIEWVREIAHEYGHFALPGVSGYTAPEEWANGVLGERLFLKWLRDDLRAGRLRSEDLSFVTPEQLDDYIARQVTPLVRRFVRDGAEERLMGKRDAGGMDYYTGFALYLDSVYGSRALLDALAYTSPSQNGVFIRATDFLKGAQASLAGATEFTVTLPRLDSEKPVDALMLYLPRGEYTITTEGPVRSWRFDTTQKGLHANGRNGVIANLPGWRKLRVSLAQTAGAPARLTFHRRGSEVQ